MATQISDIGKSAAIEALFKESGFSNEIRTAFRAEGEVGAVQRLFIENIDFDLTYHPMKHLGYKLSLCIMGELYSLFREPETLLFTVGLSNRFSFEDVKELWKGVTAAAKEHSVHHIGLDLVPSPSGMIIACTGYGVRDTKSVSDRTEPSATDLLILSGNVGAAYMGMHVLEREKVAFVKTPNGVLPPSPT